MTDLHANFMTTIRAEELAAWTPVAIDLEAPVPSIDWGDFGSLRFAEPFFDETVAKWAAANPAGRMVRTGLDALVVLDQAPSLDPSGFIFHLSRCGSTLLTRLLQQIPGCVIVSEPTIINELLLTDDADLDEESRVQFLRMLVRALGRKRFADERHYVLKLSSWNIRKLELFRRAFPQTPLVWLQRKPAEIIASLLAHEPEWRASPKLARTIFNLADDLAASEPKAFYVEALTAMLKAASSFPAEVMGTIDYSELPQAAWMTVAPHFGLTLNAGEIALMETQSHFYSKDSILTPFSHPKDAEDAISESIQQFAAPELDCIYRELSVRKVSTPSPRQSTV